MRALDIAFHRTGAVGVGAVDQRRDLGRLAAPHRSAEIRRDLNKLTRQGLINRTYGGAMIVPSGIDRPFMERNAVHREERIAIARRAEKRDCQVDYGFA